jgi:hypothetical protein
MLGSSLFSWLLVLLAAWGCRRFLRQSWSKKKVCLNFFHYVCRRYCFFSWNGTSWILVFLFSGIYWWTHLLGIRVKMCGNGKKKKKRILSIGLFVIYRLLSDGKMKELGISMFGFCPFVIYSKVFCFFFFLKQILFLLTWAYIHVCAHIFKQKLSPMSFKVNK